MVDGPVEELVEFRNYEIVPGGIDAFVRHFEDHFLESQEELGMDIVGQFRLVDDAQRFVWIRRYLEPSSRGASLGRFYTGPVWKEFGPRANELMVDHNDVHLLVPHASASAFPAGHVPHEEQRGAAIEATSTVVAAFYELDERLDLSPEVVSEMAAAVKDAPGVVDLGRLVTAAVPNDFASLPVHEDAIVALWLLSDPSSAGGWLWRVERGALSWGFARSGRVSSAQCRGDKIHHMAADRVHTRWCVREDDPPPQGRQDVRVPVARGGRSRR